MNNISVQLATKYSLRNRFTDLREKLDKNTIESCNSSIYPKLLKVPEIKAAQRIAAYLPINNEISINNFIDNIIKSKRDIFVPAFLENKNKWVYTKFFDWMNLKIVRFGVKQPKVVKQVKIESIEVFILPGLAFDFGGTRLGYGKGDFDKLLKGNNTFKIGVAYDFQIVKVLPKEIEDVPVDLIITEKRTISTRN